MDSFTVSSELTARYIQNRRNELDTLRVAVNDRDFTTIASKGHNMKGSAESFGFPELGVIGNKMELAASEKNFEEVKSQMSLFEQWLEKNAP